ncbi:trypsin-1-like [Cydia pomonella]|uniref:trypsin-1-like n=1 Tax=Cydia pomonella TaxID=82600 RepID=UPI002ADDAC4F|nr:trypsin-1-like [Cydia pomonella]
MMVHFLLLVIALWAVPVDPEKYDVLVVPLSNSVRKKALQVYLLPRTLTKPNHPSSHRLDMEDVEEPTEAPDVDNFDGLNLDRDDNALDNIGASYNVEDDYDAENRIVGGTEVDINMYPYHVGYGTNCGGAIIGSKWVLTAGHCGKKEYIRSGSKYLNRGKRTQVLNNHIHPMWSANNKEHPFDYDFQVLELQQELNFDENTQPIKIARIEDMVVGKMVTVTGWGNTQENGPYSSVLKAVSVPIIGKDHCQKVPFPYFRGALTPRMFCAGYREGKKDACQGDSGGPAVSYDRLLGMVSFGYGCATPGSYGVYSKVAKVRDWIRGITGLTLE